MFDLNFHSYFAYNSHCLAKRSGERMKVGEMRRMNRFEKENIVKGGEINMEVES